MPSTRTNILHEIILQSSNVKKIQGEFTKSIFVNKFYQNKSALIFDADKTEFDKGEWESNPRKFCLDIYGEPMFDKIVLLVNNIKSVFSFKRESLVNNIIITPKIVTILKVLSYR